MAFGASGGFGSYPYDFLRDVTLCAFKFVNRHVFLLKLKFFTNMISDFEFFGDIFLVSLLIF